MKNIFRLTLAVLASPVASLETLLHVSWELGQILSFVENSAEENYRDLIS